MGRVRGSCLSGSIISIQMVHLAGALAPVQVGQMCQKDQPGFSVWFFFFFLKQFFHCSFLILFVLQGAKMRDCTDQRGSGKMARNPEP